MQVTPLLYTHSVIKKTEGKFKENEYPVRIRLSQFKEKAYISLGYSSSPENWDAEHNLPKPSHPYYKDLSQKINKFLDDIAFENKVAERAGRYVTCLEMKRQVTRQRNVPQNQNQLKILQYFDKVINELEEANKPGYADTFETTRSTVSKLLNNDKHIPRDDRNNEKDKGFRDFTKEDHERYYKLISDGSTESTISYYLRTYYRIWNLASKDGYCVREEHHPARFIKFQPYKKIKTKKRSINQDYLHNIMALKFDPFTRMHRSQMLLRFIYYGRGINFGDMCRLKWGDIANGTMRYTRAKNHRHYDYILHPEALKVIDHFRNYPEQSNSGNIFPFLNASHDTARKIDTRIESALKDFNEDLKAMAESVGWERKFTSYSLRHGFATHLRNNKVDMAVIKEALGHESETQTAVYLDDLDDKIVADEINKALSYPLPKHKAIRRKGRGL